MNDAIDSLVKIGVPMAIVLSLLASAWIIGERLLKREAKSTPLAEAVMSELLDRLKESQKSEDDCSKRIAVLEREREDDRRRIAALEALVAQKSQQLDTLLEIIHGPKEGSLLSDEGRKIRAWMLKHMTEADLQIASADVGLDPPIHSDNLEIQCKNLIDDATRKGLLRELSRTLKMRRPNVEYW